MTPPYRKDVRPPRRPLTNPFSYEYFIPSKSVISVPGYSDGCSRSSPVLEGDRLLPRPRHPHLPPLGGEPRPPGPPPRRLAQGPRHGLQGRDRLVARRQAPRARPGEAGAPRPRPLAAPDAVRIFGIRVPTSFASFRRWYVLAAFSAVMAVGVLGWRAISNGRPHYVPNGDRPAVAVLPFVNGTGDAGLNYLRESVPDHLIRDLQRSSEHLRVYTFSAVIETVRKLGLEPGAPLTPDELAAVSDRLGAGWLVVGFLARSGAKIRVDYEVREARGAAPLKTDHVPGTEGGDAGRREPRRRRRPPRLRRPDLGRARGLRPLLGPGHAPLRGGPGHRPQIHVDPRPGRPREDHRPVRARPARPIPAAPWPTSGWATPTSTGSSTRRTAPPRCA